VSVFYSGNRTGLGNYDGEDIVANENYFGEFGSFQMVVEGCQNDQAVFDAVISQDFAEVAAMHENMEFEAVTEAGVSSFVDKIKEFVKKAWAKIKGLLKSFVDKFTGIIIRDNKKFVEKYKKQVLQKTNLHKMKYKWAEPADRSFNIEVDKRLAAAVAVIDSTKTDVFKDSETELDSVMKEVSSSDFMEKLYAKTVGEGSSITASEFSKQMHEKAFAEEKEVEGLKDSDLNHIMSILTESSTILKNVKSYEKKVDEAFSKALKDTDKLKADLKFKDEESSKADRLTMKRCNVYYKLMSAQQTVANKTSAGLIDACKFHIKQCRRVFQQAVTFNKSVNEEAELLQAVGEAAEFEIESSFASYETV